MEMRAKLITSGAPMPFWGARHGNIKREPGREMVNYTLRHNNVRYLRRYEPQQPN